MTNLSTVEWVGLFVIGLLPLIVLSLPSRATLMRLFFPDAKWYMEVTRAMNRSKAAATPSPTHSSMLYLEPFKADRLPVHMRTITDEKKTYADLLDLIKANGGMGNWINAELAERLNALGCQCVQPEDNQVPQGHFVLSGEVLTTVRTHDMSQIAFKIKLTVDRRTIFSKLYTATCRETNSYNMTQALGLDGFIRPPFAGMSNRKTNRLLANAMTEVMQQLSSDLNRILPYLGRPEVQYAG